MHAWTQNGVSIHLFLCAFSVSSVVRFSVADEQAIRRRILLESLDVPVREGDVGKSLVGDDLARGIDDLPIVYVPKIDRRVAKPFAWRIDEGRFDHGSIPAEPRRVDETRV